MEESSLSAKRKRRSSSQFNSNSLIGVVTRSKSRIYFDHNQSGIARSEQVSEEPILFQPEVESVEAFLEANCNSASRVSSIKDLRMHRVFTPDVNSVPEEEAEQVKKKKVKDLDTGLGSNQVTDMGVGDTGVDKLEKSEIMIAETQDEQSDAKHGLKDQLGNGAISESKTAVDRCGRRKVFKNVSSFSYRRLLPYLMDIANEDSGVHKIEVVDPRIPCKLQKVDCLNSEKVDNEDAKYVPTKGPSNDSGCSVEIVRPPEVNQKGNENDLHRVCASIEEEYGQMTPPDPDIFNKSGGGSVESNNLHVDKQDFTWLSIGSGKDNEVVLRRSPNGKRGTNSINEGVLNPCSRLRLFKNPRSLSYRRLLPFLMDISKNNYGASRTTPQVDLKEDLHRVSTSTAELNSLNKTRTENFYENQRTEDGSSPDANNSLVSSMPQSSSMSDSSKVEPSSVNSEALVDPCTPISLQTGRIPQSQSSPRKLEQGFNLKENCSPSFVMSNDILTEQSACEEPEPVGLHDDKAEQMEKINLNLSSSHNEVSNASVAPTNGPLKGILKKNRKGCRGLCNCLNCTSFRLHADRAFEFSRNQMHDAEEVASVLMKELINLRLLWEKSIVNDNNLAAIQLNPDVIEQACIKAMEAENAAKERLNQLNDDLNVHCRIPVLLLPKVTFAANCIQERDIPVLNPSTSVQKQG